MTSAWVGILVLSCLVVVALAGDKSPSSSKTPSLTPQSLSPTPSSTPSNTPSNSRPAALPSGWPTSRTVTGVIRDFHGLGENDCSTSNRICAQIPAGCQHNDFERAISNDRGIVLTTLGPDRLPQWNSAKFPSNTITSLDLANMWFHTQDPITVNGKTCYINQPANLSLTATWDSSRGLYTYQNAAFWPIDGVMGFNYPSLTSNHNFHFTFELHSQFIYAGLEVFTFTGDDDVWVFINNQLVLDLGGVHGAQTQCFSLIQPGRSGYPNGPCVDSACDGGKCIGNLVSTLNLVIGNTYNFDFFFAERHTTASNINFATNFPLDTCLTPDACGICNGPNTVNVCTGANPPNCGAHGSCICATGGCVCDAGWTGPNCDSFCGDGIVQSQEQCDTGATNTGCCNTTTCKFLSAGTTCPRESNPCIAQVCDGAGTCGVVQNTTSDGQPIVCASSAVTVNGVVDACKRYICSNGQCVVGPKPVGTDCGTSSCTQRQCNATGTCVVTGTVTCVSAGTCFGVGTCQANSNNNVYPGTCSNPPLSFGTSCGTSSNVCQVRVCDGTGSCITNNVADGTSCGSSDTCFANVCLSGQCTRTNTNTGSTCGSLPAQCTVNQCSDGSCVSLPAAGTCTGTGADSKCQSYSCSGGSCVIVNKAQGTSCTLSSPNQCSVGQCSSGACVAVPANQGANCTSGSNGPVTDPGFCQDNVCQGTQCLPVNVNSGLSCTTGPSISVPACNNNVCVSGVCSTVATNQGGTCIGGTPLTSTSCQKYSCSNGACIVVAKNEGGTCPLSSANDCSSGVCSSGTCAAVAANAGQTCTNGSTGVGPAATFCTSPKCQGTVCAASNVKEGQTFSIGGSGCPALTTQACQQYRCVGGSCTVEATNVGGSCGTATACQKFVCQADGTCATVNINEGNVCANSGTCTPSTCQSGTCTPAPITCTAPTDCYTIGPCANGVCPTPVLTSACSCGDGTVQSPTSTPPGTEQCDTGSVANPCCSNCSFAASTTSCGTDTECKTFKCSGSSTACLQSNKTAGAPCSELVADECNDVQCDGFGNCVYSAKTGSSCGQPTDCQTAVCGTGSATQRATCQYTPLTDGVSCTSLTGTKECHTKTCSSGVCSFTYVGDSGAACASLTDTECALAKCSATTKACALTSRRTSAASPSINCSSVTAGDCTIAQCNTNGACALVPLTGQSCSVSGYTPDGCADPVCSSAGLCALVPRTNGIDCSAASGLSAECQKATCSSGKCYLVFDPAASCTSLAPTDCSDPVCDAQTKACRHQSKRTSPSDPVIPCTGPTATACEAPQCGTDGSCGLVAQPGEPCTLDGFVSDGCSNPVCDVDGVCSLEAVVDGTSCTLSGINPECQTSECVAGACTAVSKRQSASDPVISCTSVSDTPCEVAQCGLDGVCALVALADGHQSTCDALQDPTDVCSEMLCQAGSCVRSSLSAGTPCTDSNLCDVDTCDGNGECVRTPTDIANSCAVPLGPCFSAGWCESATGACNYTQFGAGTLCIPKTPDSGGCRYFTCSADAVCTKACVIHTVCGNGVVEPGEDCDWASRSFTSRCCSHNCTWFEEFTSCNATRNMTALLEDIPKGKQQYADECLSDYCDADHSCVTSWNQSVAKVCALGGSSKNTQYVAGVAAGLTVAACLAFGLAALALALFIWQMKKADQAWKKEFLDEHKGIIEQNAAFAGPATNPSNPAYGLH